MTHKPWWHRLLPSFAPRTKEEVEFFRALDDLNEDINNEVDNDMREDYDGRHALRRGTIGDPVEAERLPATTDFRNVTLGMLERYNERKSLLENWIAGHQAELSDVLIMIESAKTGLMTLDKQMAQPTAGSAAGGQPKPR